VACECSGVVRDAFLKRGHDAMSCDLKASETNGPHYQGDVRDVLYESWDLLIAHPICKRLANSGVRWLHERPEYMDAVAPAAEFFMLFDRATHIPMRAVENPVMHKYGRAIVGRKADQYVQPHYFGSPFQKATGLWLHGLPKLRRTHWPKDYPPGTVFKQAVWLMGPSPTREADRSRTDPAVARAMAEQWGGTLAIENVA
jgi:hypothetical protein